MTFDDKPDYEFYYTLCGENTKNCHGKNTHASIYPPTIGDCKVITTNNYFADLIEEKDYKQGFSITFESSGEKAFNDSTKNLTFKANLKCDHNNQSEFN